MEQQRRHVQRQKPGPGEIWKETINVGWKFKGDDAWLYLQFKDGKHFKTGDLRFLPAKDLFELTVLPSRRPTSSYSRARSRTRS